VSPQLAFAERSGAEQSRAEQSSVCTLGHTLDEKVQCRAH
jgi:hypothetical protein